MLFAQVANTGMAEQMDSSEAGKLVLSGYLDVYYGFDFNQPKESNRPYCVSSNRHNEVNVNLAYIGLNYSNERIRARFIPGFGTYVNANYAAETGTLKNIIEANAGVRLSKEKNIWIDAGIIGSPYTNESAISKDHLMYTRSLAPEYVPYYLSGLKLSAQLSEKFTGYLYMINGWQKITDTNNQPSFGTQLEYRPTKKLLLNWNTYVGNESSPTTPQYGIRYFSDVYAIYNPEGKFCFTSCVYAGVQQQKLHNNMDRNSFWWQANFIARVKLSKSTSVSGRIEYFNDPDRIQITPVTAVNFFNGGSASLCFNVKITKSALFRMENRFYFSEKNVYERNKSPVNNGNLLIGNLTVWF
jgi:hypothetical protein